MHVRLMIVGSVALYIYMLAAFTGYEVISRVPAILHTPLMSGRAKKTLVRQHRFLRSRNLLNLPGKMCGAHLWVEEP